MHNPAPSYRIFPLGDSAVTIDFGKGIDETVNRQVLARFRQLRKQPLPGVTELIPAYHTLTVCYDLWYVKKTASARHTGLEWICQKLEERLQQPLPEATEPGRSVEIPVCYEKEYAPDLSELAGGKNISVADVIRIHTAKEYRVYMLGFLPGFSYMGEVDEAIAISRKKQPLPVAAGSVGIAGRQTGIYPVDSPGGWQIIGKTPLQLFDPLKEQPVLLQPGDRVRFYSITADEFKSY
jgi:inhibitor of KinA